MDKYKKILIWVTGVIGCLVAFILVSSILLHQFVNLEVVKEKIQRSISHKVKGEVKFHEVDLSLFPLPIAKIHQVTLSVPETLSGEVESVAVNLKILPLIKGKVLIAGLHFEAPRVAIVLPEKIKGKGEGLSQFFLGQLREEVASLSALEISEVTVEVTNGDLSLSEGDETSFRFWDIQARINGSSDRLKLAYRCASTIWESMSLQGRFNLFDLSGDGDIKLKGFQPDSLAGHLRKTMSPFRS